MSSEKKQAREYPPLYEKLIPIAIGLIVITILVLLGITAAILFGVFPG